MWCYTKKYLIPFLIDDDDWEVVQRYTWSMAKYPMTTIYGRAIRLHQFLLGKAPNGLDWDHENRMRWDNRRSNLRLVTRSINIINKGLIPANTSGVNGVFWSKGKQLWCVQIKRNGQRFWVGNYETIEAATEARKDAEDVFDHGHEVTS